MNQLTLPRKSEGLKKIIVNYTDQIDIPACVEDFDSFRRWLHREDFPENGKTCFIKNTVWVDLSKEDFFTHGQVLLEISRVLGTLVKETKFGRFGRDRTRYSHLETNLSTEPDGIVISYDAINSGRVRFQGGEKGEKTELIGSPEIVIEVLSRSSEEKDTEWLITACFDAGIQEYWLIDAREVEDIQFNIFKRNKKEFVATKTQHGWVKSAVLSKTIRLVQSEGDDGEPVFTLEAR
jgi:Uma2 family endonuclease